MTTQNNTPAVKRPYATPVVQVFGSIRELTQAVGKNGNSDNSGNQGSSSKSKT